MKRNHPSQTTSDAPNESQDLTIDANQNGDQGLAVSSNFYTKSRETGVPLAAVTRRKTGSRPLWHVGRATRDSPLCSAERIQIRSNRASKMRTK